MAVYSPNTIRPCFKFIKIVLIVPANLSSNFLLRGVLLIVRMQLRRQASVYGLRKLAIDLIASFFMKIYAKLLFEEYSQAASMWTCF